MRHKIIKKILIVLSVLWISSCSLLPPLKTPTINKYILTPTAFHIPKKQTHAITLLVLTPETQAIYNTTQMAYTIKPGQVAFFSQNEWAATPSQMLQLLIVQTLQNTHYFHAIVTPPYVASYAYVLDTQILQLQQDFTQQPAMLQFTVRAQLTRVITDQVVATKVFSIREPISPASPQGGVAAANRATAKLLQQLTGFVFAHMPR